jgi:hypothetical protein
VELMFGGRWCIGDILGEKDTAVLLLCHCRIHPFLQVDLVTPWGSSFPKSQ